MSHLLSVENISLTYPSGKQALKDINFKAKKGEFIGLIGANGAGKSSLIHVMAGVLKPTTGKVTYNLDDPKKIAWVSQQTTIDWYLNAFDNVRLGARLGGYDTKMAYKKAVECMSLVELNTEDGKCRADCLSGGQQKRVQIARALAQSPKILILDEPTTGLDPIACKTLMANLQKVAKGGGLVIISSHDLTLLEDYVERILYLDNGNLEANDDVSAFIKNHISMSEITISYSGELNGKILKKLESLYTVLSTNPLIIQIPHAISLGEILRSIDSDIEIQDINRSAVGLKLAYEQIKNGKK